MLLTTNGYQIPTENGKSNHVPTGEGIKKLDDTLNKVLPLSFAGGDVTLTQAQLMSAVFSLNGATAARTLTMPAFGFRRLFVNASAFDITVKHAATTGVVVPAGTVKDLYSDGVTVKDGSSGATSSASAPSLLAHYAPGKPEAAEVLFKIKVLFPFTLDFSDAYLTLDVAPTASFAVNFYNDATLLNTATVPASATTGTYANTSTVELTGGWLAVIAPTPVDTTASGVAFGVKAVS